MGELSLEEYAKSGKYLKWTETDTHDICLNCTYEEFKTIKPVLSSTYESDQYEIPVICVDYISDGSLPFESVLATKSKNLLVDLLNAWHNDPTLVLRVTKKGSGFYTKWNVVLSDYIYDMASGKVKRLPPKKK